MSGKFDTNKSKLKAGFILFLSSFIIALPRGFLMVYNSIERDCDARSFFKTKINNSSLTYYQIYFTFTEPILFWFIPGLLILFMNFYVIYKIIDSNRTRPDKLGVRPKSSCNDEFSRKFNSTITHKYKTSFDRMPSHQQKNDMDALKVNLIKKKQENNQNRAECYLTSKSLKASENNKMKKINSSLSLKSICELSNKTSNECINKQISNRNNNDPNKLSVNQLSHYITIITVGFYFILSTIPFGIMLSIQNNLTLKLDYNLKTKQDYLSDPLWKTYGFFRECVAVTKLFFVSNHCFNFILYYLFNNLFRKTFHDLFVFKFKYCCGKLTGR